jgi:hypothetical protein
LAAGASAGALAVGFAAVASAGAVAAGEVETTTVVDLTSVVVQAPAVVVVLDEGAAAAGVLVEDAATTGGLEAGAAAAGVFEEGADAAGAVAELPALDDTFDPAGAAGDGGGEACLAMIVVSRSAVTVVSRRAVPVFDALRTLSGGRAGEADRAVARRTCSIIAE